MTELTLFLTIDRTTSRAWTSIVIKAPSRVRCCLTPVAAGQDNSKNEK